MTCSLVGVATDAKRKREGQTPTAADQGGGTLHRDDANDDPHGKPFDSVPPAFARPERNRDKARRGEGRRSDRLGDPVRR